MRELYSHKTGGLNEGIRIYTLDDPGYDGANHKYEIVWKSDGNLILGSTIVSFQNGTVKDAGNNGLTNEALLAVVIDRLETFQRGPFACVENDTALASARTALSALKMRTQKRIARGVEGTHTP